MSGSFSAHVVHTAVEADRSAQIMCSCRVTKETSFTSLWLLFETAFDLTKSFISVTRYVLNQAKECIQYTNNTIQNIVCMPDFKAFFKRIYWWGKYVIDLCSELEVEDGGSRPRAEVRGPRSKPWVGFLRRQELKGLGSAVSSPSGVRGEAPAAVDFEGFGTSQNAF